MKLKSWMINLLKPKFYFRYQPKFVAGSCGQNNSRRLKSAESHMPFPSARRAATCFCWGLFLAIPFASFSQNTYTPNGTEYSIIGSLPGDQVYPDIGLN